MASLKKSIRGQVAQMERRFPDLHLTIENNTLIWTGNLRPFQKIYSVRIYWGTESYERPYVVLETPSLAPREGEGFEDIPHLLFNQDNPAKSGMCLFDPEQKQWDPRYDYIAKTTIPWAAKWLANYEYWHLTGEWLGEGILPATVRELSGDNNDEIGEAA